MKQKIKHIFKKVFYPHEGNNHHPHFWRPAGVITFLALVLVVELGIFSQSVFLAKNENFFAAVLPGVLVAYTNEYRAQVGAPTLTVSPILEKAAKLKADDMVRRQYFAHYAPDGTSPWSWLQQVGYSYVLAGENLAVDFSDSKDVAQAWLNSPTHKKNLLKANYREIGIATAEGEFEGKHTIFVVQFFGTPVATSGVATSKSASSTVLTIATSTSKMSSSTSTKSASTSSFALASSSKIVNVASTSPATITAARVEGAEVVTSSITTTSEASSVRPVVGSMSVKKLLTSPRTVAFVALSLLLIAVLLSLVIALVGSKKGVQRLHPRIISACLLFLIVLLGTYLINTRLYKPHVIISSPAGGEVVSE